MIRQALRLKMEKIIEGWKESGLPQKDWCERKKITYSTFHYWYKHYRQQEIRISEPQDNFVQLDVQDGRTESALAELVFPDGKRLIFYQQIDDALIKVLTS